MASWPWAVVVVVLVATTPVVAGSHDAVVVVYDGHGTQHGFEVSGRVLEDRHGPVAKQSDHGGRNALRMLSDLESNEVRGVDVDVEIAGSVYSATTDADGVFRVRVRGPSTSLLLPVGPIPVHVSLRAPTFSAAPADGTIHVAADGGVGLVSDIDDTVVKTWVTDKRRMARQLLLANAEQLEPVVGAAAAYRSARAHGVDAVFYISSSPQNLYTRLKRVLDKHGYPPGPLLLKNFGTDAVFDHDAYKLKRLEQLMVDHPGMRFVLVGDSGERDPEIYGAFRARHPDVVVAVVIRVVPGTIAMSEARCVGMTLVNDAYAADDVISQLVPVAAAK